ncbi:MAG TPA: hypothetical protein DDW52_00690 [Planctomycetaceae bacterium]|nr:hypothetical protein [Planctomycetaceae bacterium]
MKSSLKKVACGAVAMIIVANTVAPAMAVSKLKKAFATKYAPDDADEDFKGLVKKAGCYACHVKGEKKKVRNDYGKALEKAFEKNEFPLKDWEKDQEKYADKLEEIFKKVEGEKSGFEKHKTFGDRIKANLLPGGDVEGKKETDEKEDK